MEGQEEETKTSTALRELILWSGTGHSSLTWKAELFHINWWGGGGGGLHAPKPVWAQTAQTFIYFNQQQKPGISSSFCTSVTYDLVSNHIPWLLPPRSSVSLSHFAFPTPYHGSACTPLIKLKLDKPDNSQLTMEDGGKCRGKIMMREREEWRAKEHRSGRHPFLMCFLFFCFFNMNPWQTGAFSSVTSVLLDSLQIDRKTQLARHGNTKIWCVSFHNTAQAHHL